ncbi:putative AP2/ERF family transcription factor family protein [Skeletonema marinoi]|uniref:AP2/ERF family transcription factor family protein n=1 Tax=Skeletonema marinoi TaxID=267567 RepID=A0AAD8Y6H7_9STRA|nr:putative AP2/ERF family transcription factor family protein [Skeletonema marinoi]
MVTRTVILVTASEAAAFAATSLSTPAAASADSINNAPAEQINLDEELQTNNLCNYPSYSKPAQDASPGGLVQLCRHKGCFHAVDFERRNGLCCVHQKGPMDGEQNDSSEDDGKIQLCSFRGCINGVTSDEGRCDTHATHGNKYGLGDEVGKKRALTSGDSICGKDDIKRQRVDAFVLDLTGVPPQSPITKSEGRIKEGASKYTGVTFNKKMNKWQAQIRIEGKVRFIGSSENEEEAAVDYARAVFKYKNQAALSKAREQDSFIDLSDVPPQSPISKSEGRIKEGASKYTGVSFDKRMNKWHAQIRNYGMNRTIGYYENEEEAATDYARAVFKYKGQEALDKARERRAQDKSRERNSIIIDLSGIPPQPPITKRAGLIKEGSSKYTGVTFNKKANKWLAKIRIEGKQRQIGSYENEEAAAVDYARAVFKYRGQFGTESQSDRNN